MRLAKIGGVIFCFCVALLGASDASAQIYMETVGPAIQGDATAAGYENQIVLDSGQWGVGSYPCGGGGLSVSEFTLTKQADRATVDLLSAIQSGTIFTEIIVRYVTSDGGGGFIDYQTYRFKSATLTGYSTSSGGDRPSESLSIYFSEVEIEYVHIDGKGGQSPETMTLTAPACAAF